MRSRWGRNCVEVWRGLEYAGGMIGLAGDPVLPAWVVLPLAVVAMLATCGHLMLMQRVSMPASRRRIRTAAGVLSLFLIPLTAIGFGALSPADHRVFLLVWLTVMGMLSMLVVLASLDVLNNVRLHAGERARLRANMQRLRGELRRAIEEQRARAGSAKTLGLSRDDDGDAAKR